MCYGLNLPHAVESWEYQYYLQPLEAQVNVGLNIVLKVEESVKNAVIHNCIPVKVPLSHLDESLKCLGTSTTERQALGQM